jgi:hypothetical protein
MSEQLAVANPEHAEKLQKTPEHQEHRHERSEHDPTQSQHEQHELLRQARQELHKQTPDTNPNPLERLEAAEAATQPAAPQTINRELKAITLRRELQHIRRKLPTGDRVLSRIVHQPAIRVVSEAAGKTISRPSGLLGGGLVAFLGTGSYYWLARHMGYRYNSTVSFLLFFGGFALGVGIELAVHLSSRPRVD